MSPRGMRAGWWEVGCSSRGFWGFFLYFTGYGRGILRLHFVDLMCQSYGVRFIYMGVYSNME
jgi:hypothetical protein